MRRFVNDWVLMRYRPRHVAVVLGLLTAWAIIAACSPDEPGSIRIKDATTDPLEISAI